MYNQSNPDTCKRYKFTSKDSQTQTSVRPCQEQMMIWFRLAALVGVASLCFGCWPIPRVDQEDYCFADHGMCFVLSSIFFLRD